jgi:hypothetical protein
MPGFITMNLKFINSSLIKNLRYIEDSPIRSSALGILSTLNKTAAKPSDYPPFYVRLRAHIAQPVTSISDAKPKVNKFVSNPNGPFSEPSTRSLSAPPYSEIVDALRKNHK